MKSLSVKIILVGVLGLIAPIVFAQTTPDINDPGVIDQINQLDYQSSVNDSDIDVTLDPESPGAYQPVSIHLDSNTIDLNRYVITWIENGTVKQSAMGLRDYQTTSGAYGTTTNITVQVKTGIVPLQKNITLAPQDATILWEAIDSYVPPFYRGKKLPGYESLIKVSAFPNFSSANSSTKLNDAVYLWDRNDNRILGVGGYAKDSIIIKQNRLRTSETIAATVSSVDGSTSTQKSVTIPVYNPEIHWYARDQFGYRRLAAIDNGLRISGGDTSIIAEPYFFSTTNGPSDLETTWNMNNTTLSLDPSAPNTEIVVRNPGKTGQTNFQISIKNPMTFLQEAAKSISLYFENQ